MPVPCLLPRAAHPARCTPLRYVLFPVLWFLRFVYDLFSCVVCIVRAEPFYPLYIPCVLFVLMCCIFSVLHLCIFYGVFVYPLYRVRAFSVLCICRAVSVLFCAVSVYFL